MAEIDDFIRGASRGALRLEELGGQFLDPTSQIFQQFGSQLQERLNAASPTLNSLLGLQRSSGLGVGASTAIATEQREAIEARNRAQASTGQQGLFTQLAGTGAGLIGQGMQGFQNLAQLKEQQRQFDESQPSFLGELGRIAGFGAGSLLGGQFGDFLGTQLTDLFLPSASSLTRRP